jgi:hypothetical protein
MTINKYIYNYYKQYMDYLLFDYYKIINNILNEITKNQFFNKI